MNRSPAAASRSTPSRPRAIDAGTAIGSKRPVARRGRWLRDAEERRRIGDGIGLPIPKHGIPPVRPAVPMRDQVVMIAVGGVIALGLKLGPPIVFISVVLLVVVGIWIARPLIAARRELKRLEQEHGGRDTERPGRP